MGEEVSAYGMRVGDAGVVGDVYAVEPRFAAPPPGYHVVRGEEGTLAKLPPCYVYQAFRFGHVVERAESLVLVSGRGCALKVEAWVRDAVRVDSKDCAPGDVRAEGFEEICPLVVGRGLGGGICGYELRFAPFDFEHGGSQPAGGAYAFGGSHAGPGGVNVFVRCSSLDGAVGDDDRCASVCDTIRSLLAIGGEEKQVEAFGYALVFCWITLGQLVFLYENGCDGGRFVLSVYGCKHSAKFAFSCDSIGIFRNEARTGVWLYIATLT